MCETWHNKCNAFIDKEFINVFISEYQLSKQLESQVKNEEIINRSIKSLMKYPIKFEIEKVVFMLIKLNKVKEVVLLLCTRFLFIQEYEKEENKLASTRDIPIRKEFDTYREKENECVLPILEILTQIFNAYVIKLKNDSGTLEYFSNILDKSNVQDITIYDYLKNEILEKKDANTLIKMKSDFIKEILMHDSEGLHNTILTWMIDKELYDDLENVDSPYYDKFVEKIENQGKLNISQISLVSKYLLKTRKFNRLIHFLVPIIWADTQDDNSRIQGE